MLTRDPLFHPVSPMIHPTEIQGAIINIAKWVLASLTAAVWMAADVGKVFFFFFLPKLEPDFRDGVISRQMLRERKWRFWKKFFYILAMKFCQIGKEKNKIENCEFLRTDETGWEEDLLYIQEKIACLDKKELIKRF